MNEVTSSPEPNAVSYIAIAAGVLAFGAIAVGAIAIGSLVIGRLAVQKVRLHTVEIDNLTVRRLRVLEGTMPETQGPSAGDHPSSAPSDAAPENNGKARPAARRRRPRKAMPN